MGKKKKWTVYSTNPDFEFNQEREEHGDTLDPSEQVLRIWLDRKKRRGKAVTLITGFEGSSDDMKELGDELKKKCGSGGSAKDGEIIIQGDHRKKVLDLLLERGYSKSKLAGG